MTRAAAPRVLLVEDNVDSADMLARRLRRRGFVVEVVGDGAAAVSAARAARPDIVLMDMSLPVMDGWTATRAIKSELSLADVPVMALTAHTMAEDEAKARAAGCDDFHAKPIEFNRLVAQLAKLGIGPDGGS